MVVAASRPGRNLPSRGSAGLTMVVAAVFLVPLLSATLLSAPVLSQAPTFNISSNPALRQVDPGEDAVFTITVSNTGTASDVIDLVVTGAPSNWTYLFSDDSIELGAGEDDSVTLLVKPSDGAAVGDAVLSVNGAAAVGGGSASAEVTVRVKQVFRLDMDVSPVSYTNAGGSTAFTVTVFNLGNGPDTVTLSIVPTGRSTSIATTTTKTLDIEAGSSAYHVHDLKVPSDAEGGWYTFTIRARSSGAGVDASENVEFKVKATPSSDLELDTWMLVLILIIVFVVIAAVAMKATPAGKKAPPKAGKGKKGKAAGKDGDGDEEEVEAHGGHGDLAKRLDRLEDRMDRYHEHLVEVQRGHHQVSGHLQLHLMEHHGKDDEEVAREREAVAGVGTSAIGEMEDTDMEQEVAAREGEGEGEEHEPAPVPDDVPAEGPPENMSVGDETGEILRSGKNGDEGQGDVVDGGRCPVCSNELGPGWTRCAFCGHHLER